MLGKNEGGREEERRREERGGKRESTEGEMDKRGGKWTMGVAGISVDRSWGTREGENVLTIKEWCALETDGEIGRDESLAAFEKSLSTKKAFSVFLHLLVATFSAIT